MSALAQVRTIVTTALEQIEVPGLVVFDHIPGRFTPPALLVLPADPYVDQGETFGEVTVHLAVAAVTPLGPNPTQSTDLEALAEEAFVALAQADLEPFQISAPFTFEVNGIAHLGCSILIDKTIHL